MGIVVGTDTADWLAGGGGADYLKGFGGNDTLKGGGGADTLDGGAGIDTALYADSPWGVVVDLETGIGNPGYAYGDRLYNIENVWGSGSQDTIFGNNGANALYGSNGDDYLFGRFGTDLLDGGYENDDLDGGAGADTLNGGPGSDTASYYWSPAGVYVSLFTGIGYGGEAQGDSLISIENLQGSAFADTFYGDDAANTLNGDGGDDTIDAGGGADMLTGHWGNDRLYGREGDDRLDAGAGQDRLEGGTGIDTMSGGDDGDVFVWSATAETGLTSATADRIMDFNFAEGDRIDLSVVDADVYAAGNQAFTFIGTAAFSGTPGEINYIHSGGATYIQMQTGTSADVEGVISIAGIVTPEASWFIL